MRMMLNRLNCVELQDAYRRRVQSDAHLFHQLGTRDALEANVLKLRDDLVRLRRGVKQWAIAVAGLLVLILLLVAWMVRTPILNVFADRQTAGGH